MGSVNQVPNGWRARWRTPEGGSRSQTFARKQDAQRHLAAVEGSKVTGAYVDPSAGKVIFKAYAEQWRSIQVHRPSTEKKLEGQLRLHVYPSLGARPMGAIRQSEVQGLVKSLDSTLAPATVALVYSWVVAIFRAAVADKIIASSPCHDIKRRRVERRTVVPLPVETVERLVADAPDRYRALFVLGAGTGVRISEALGVTTDRVDWMRRLLVVDRQLVGQRDGEPVFGPVKDQRNRPRTIPLPDTVLTALVEHVRVFGLGPHGLLFTTEAGRPVRGCWTIWRKVADPLGIPKSDGYHTLRHFYASLLIRHGESPKVVQERLGHASSKMTLDIYSHLWPEDEDRTRAAVDVVLFSRVSELCHAAIGDS
jgi:integrase